MCLSHLIYTVRPSLIHTFHAMPMPRPYHALTMPSFSRPRYSTAVERRPVGYLPAFGFFRLSRGVPLRLLSEAYQSSSQRSIPTTVKSGSSTLQKIRSVKLLDWQFGYFRLPHGLSRRTRHCRSRAGARHDMCELTARHGRGMPCVNRPLDRAANGTSFLTLLGYLNHRVVLSIIYISDGRRSRAHIILKRSLLKSHLVMRLFVPKRKEINGDGHSCVNDEFPAKDMSHVISMPTSDSWQP
jgi:hypothetical protein